MPNFKGVIMKNLGLILGVFFWSFSSFAANNLQTGEYKSTVTDVTAEYLSHEDSGANLGIELLGIVPTPTPLPGNTTIPTLPTLPTTGTTPSSTPGSIAIATPTPSTLPTPYNTGNIGGLGGGIGGLGEPPILADGNLGTIISIGERIWDFILTNKPNADYQTLKTSVVPEGITSWTQLSQWSKPVVKIYQVTFTNKTTGKAAGGFAYRMTYFHSGVYKGKGKFIGQISIVPTNVHLKTDRSLKMRAELEATLNFGTESDPVAGAQISVTWSTPTTTHYEMESAEYMIYGTGELVDLTNGTP